MTRTDATKEQLYAEVSHTLNSLLADANPCEREALYHALEWLGIAEIRASTYRATEFEASADELETPSADLLSQTAQTIKD